MAIHPSAIVEDGAVLGNDVSVGAMAFIGRHVKLGDGCIVNHHASIIGHTTAGRGNRFHPFCAIGGEPQDLSYDEEQTTYLVIGDENTFREFVTVNRGTLKEPDRTTRIGNQCLFMAGAHVAHDCVLQDSVIMANNVMLAGHVRVGSHANISGMVGVHHFVTIGDFAYIAGWSRVRQDVPPYLISEGVPPEVRNVNHVGMQRGGIADDRIQQMRAAFKAIFRSDHVLSTAVRKFEEEHPDSCDEVSKLLHFLKNKIEGPNGRYLESVLRR